MHRRAKMVEEAFEDDHLPGTKPAAAALDALEEQVIELQRARRNRSLTSTT